MGVCLYYRTLEPISDAQLLEIHALAEIERASRDWWCESIWLTDERDEEGKIFGSTKLFCTISDEDVDTYLAYLDVQEIIRFLSEVSANRGIDWSLSIEDSRFGNVIRGHADQELKGNIANFLQWFDADFEKLRHRRREEILAEWQGR